MDRIGFILCITNISESQNEYAKYASFIFVMSDFDRGLSKVRVFFCFSTFFFGKVDQDENVNKSAFKVK